MLHQNLEKRVLATLHYIAGDVTTSVRPFNLGLHFLASKVALLYLVRLWIVLAIFLGVLMTLVQVKSVPNFC